MTEKTEKLVQMTLKWAISVLKEQYKYYKDLNKVETPQPVEEATQEEIREAKKADAIMQSIVKSVDYDEMFTSIVESRKGAPE